MDDSGKTFLELLTSRFHTGRVTRWTTILIVFIAACGSVRPASRPIEATVEVDESTQLTAVEGRPSGVVLRLSTSAEATTVELYRVVSGGDPTLLQSLNLDERLRSALAEGLDIVDSTVRAGDELTYQLFVIGEGDEVIARSQLATVSWATPPPRPVDLETNAPFPDVVEVSWHSPNDDYSAIILRRDVLAGSGFQRVGLIDAPARQWVDRDVSAAGVWSYRIALARRGPDGFLQFGAPSEEVYASTPEAD